MQILKYKVISSKKQYRSYCDILENLTSVEKKDSNIKDEIALLTLLIEKWDAEKFSATELDPVQLLLSLMKEKDLKAKDMVTILEISKGYVSDILNYKKGMSKEIIRKLADYFKVSQEAFNRPYRLTEISPVIYSASIHE